MEAVDEVPTAAFDGNTIVGLYVFPVKLKMRG